MKRIIQIIFLFEIMSLFALMFLFVFVSPSADDFCFASIINNNNWFESQIHWYNNWFGRYFSTMMATTILGTNSLFAYRAILFVIIFLHVPAVYLLFNSLSDKKNCHIIFVVSIFFVFLYFSGMPGMTEGVYWFLGTVTYSWANLALMFFIISIKYFYDTKNRKICFFLATVSGFMVIGSNEVAMLLLLIVSSALLLRDIKNIYLWWLFSIFLLLASFVVLSPGNSIRSDVFAGNNHDIIFSAIVTVGLLSALIFVWILNPLFWISAFFFVHFKIKYKIKTENRLFKARTILGIFALLLFFSVFTSFWATGEPPPARNLNTTYFIFLFSIFYVIDLISDKHESISVKFFLSNARVKVCTLILLLFFHIFVSSVFYTPLPKRGDSEFYFKNPSIAVKFVFSYYGRNNLADVYGDIISGKVFRYEKTLKKRKTIISDCRIDEICVVERVFNPPRSIFFRDISSDLSDWKNICYAEYFNLKAVKTNE